MSGVNERIVEGMARMLWLVAFSAYMDETKDKRFRRARGGENWNDLAPETPAAAMQAAQQLGNLYTLANGVSLAGIMDRAAAAERIDHDPFAPEDFGAALAHMALGDGVSWFDDHPRFELARADFEIHFDGDYLIWTGDSEPAFPNPAPRDPVPSVVIGDEVVASLDGESFRGRVTNVSIDRVRVESHGPRPEAGTENWVPRQATHRVGRGRPPGVPNPATGPTRAGEKSRFRSTARGHQRTTAVIPRSRFTTSETGKRQYTLAEMLDANQDTPDVCDRLRRMVAGQTIHVDIGGGQVRVHRVS